MRNVSREINLDVQIITKRIEEVTEIKADVITARALATVSQLLEYSKNILKDNGVCLFLKGNACCDELKIAKESWVFLSRQFGFKSLVNRARPYFIVRNGYFRRFN